MQDIIASEFYRYRIEHIYHRGSLDNPNELEMIFLSDQREYMLVFYRSGFFWVPISATLSLAGFERWYIHQSVAAPEPYILQEIKQKDSYDEFFLFFTNGVVMRIGHFHDVYQTEWFQGVQTFAGGDELQKKTAVELAELENLEIIDFRYSADAIKLS